MIKTGKNDKVVLAIVMFTAGVILTATGFTAFMEAARQYPALSRFLFGYTFVWAGLTMWNRHLTDQTISIIASTVAKASASADRDKENAEPSSGGDDSNRATPEKRY